MGLLDKISILTATTPAAPAKSPSLIDRIAEPGARPLPGQIEQTPIHARLGRKRPEVRDSPDLDRVLKLPRRPPLEIEAGKVSPLALALVEIVKARLGRDNPRCECASLGRPCILSPNPVQAWSLHELAEVGGLLGLIGVGHGKTGLGILAAMMLPDCKVAALLVPPGLVGQLIREWLAWSQHFKVPSLVIDRQHSRILPGRPVLHVVPFSKFSRPESSAILEQLRPDAIFVDEAQKLRDLGTATTSRVMRYVADHPNVRCGFWSGTLTDKSIQDYAHLAAMALGEGSPLPLDSGEVERWALAIDALEWQAPPGALLKLCEHGEHVRSGYRRRLKETPGVVGTKEGAIGATIYVHEREPEAMPPRLAGLLKHVRDEWVRPDGEEFVDELSAATAASQLACGFFYRWKYPRGEPEELIERWFLARRAWRRELRERLKAREENLDSEYLCEQAAIRAWQWAPPPLGIGRAYTGPLPIWPAESWPTWCETRNQVQPETEVIWLDRPPKGVEPIAGADYLVRDCAAWMRKERGIVWYMHDAFGQRLAEVTGLPIYGAGPEAAAEIVRENGKRSIIASIHAHGTGRDGLQYRFRTQLVANPPSSGQAWQQLLARLHRIGQPADDVDVWVYRHTEEHANAIDKARLAARYVAETTDDVHKLLTATYTFDL